METGEPRAFREGSSAAPRKGALFQDKRAVPVFVYHEPHVEILNAWGETELGPCFLDWTFVWRVHDVGRFLQFAAHVWLGSLTRMCEKLFQAN